MVRSNPSFEDRKKRVEEIKSRSKCLKCGQTGHWSGDPQCVRKEAVCSKRQVKEVSQASKTPSRTQSQEPSLATTLEYSSDRMTTLIASTSTAVPQTPAPKRIWHIAGNAPQSRGRPGTWHEILFLPEGIAHSEYDSTKDSASRKCCIGFQAMWFGDGR